MFGVRRRMANMQHISEHHGAVDRISNLPRELIHYIMEFMPLIDAARTCVLSHKWRYIWANHPSLVLDSQFWNDVKEKRAFSKINDFAKIVNRIILHHVGNVNKFVIDISNMNLEDHHDVHLWLQFLCRRGLMDLSLQGSISNPYIVPSCVFSASEMSYLKFSNCILKTYFRAGSNLKTLILEHVTLPSCFLTLSHVNMLCIKQCLGIRGLNVSSPKLVSLSLMDNDDLVLTPYLTCTDITHAGIFSRGKINRREDCESINIMNLFQCWPKISVFAVDGQCLEYLAASVAVPKEVPFAVKLRLFVACRINFEMDEMAWILSILKNACFLQRFELRRCCSPIANLSEVVNYLEEFSINLNRGMEHLRQVRMIGFTASEVEIMFVKILLHRAPLLVRMDIEENEDLHPNERLRISKELIRIPRTSPKARVIYGPVKCRKLYF